MRLLCWCSCLGFLASAQEPEDVDSLIRRLDHDHAPVRQAASKELVRRGAPVLDALRTAARGAGGESAARLEEIIGAIGRNERAKTRFLPAEPGFSWTYRVRGGAGGSRKVEVGPASDVVPPGSSKAVKAHGITGLDPAPCFVLDEDDRTRILARRHDRFLEVSVVTTALDFRWDSKEPWSFNSLQPGQHQENVVTCARKATETVTVPAGTFECVRMETGTPVHAQTWFARGIGIVKHVTGGEDARETWELEQHRVRIEQ